MLISTSALMVGDSSTFYNTFADYRNWPDVFATIHSVELLGVSNGTLLLLVSHREGLVLNWMRLGIGRIDLWEKKRHYRAHFVNHFAPHGRLCRYTVTGTITLVGWRRHLEPLLRGYATSRLRRLTLEPIRDHVERKPGSGSARTEA